jgi:GTP-binding protein
MIPADKIRNLAIVAHIDHGKTTLIDSIFHATKTFGEHEHVEERIMDSHELERERGITIRSKHCTVGWKGYRFNIIDTPGHADFSGEVERVLSMVDSVLLLVDANEGPMPQTRYVTMRALERGLTPIVILNKVDRPNADPDQGLDKTFDLFLELGATDEQADFKALFGSGLDGWMVDDLETDERKNLDPLFQAIVDHVPPPDVKENGPFLMQVSTIAYNDYVGRIGCGRVLQGSYKLGEPLQQIRTRWKDKDRSQGFHILSNKSERAKQLWVSEGLDRSEVQEVTAGDIVWLAGPAEIEIGDTFAAAELEDTALAPLEIEEPTVSMFFLINDGPFSGDDGRAITIRELRDRLERETRANVALRVEDIGRADGLKVSGRGELHLAILIEEMRREGMELCVSPPEVITHKDEDGNILEPMEETNVAVPEEFQGVVIEKLSKRKGELTGIHNTGTGVLRLEFSIPTRGLIGYRTEFLTDTKGLGILTSRFTEYAPWVGEIPGRGRGAAVSMETGEVTSYALENLQQRINLFVKPGDKVYEGQIVGENSRPMDMTCNPTKKKHITNHRSANKEIDTGLKVPRIMNLDQSMEWIGEGELVEVTPKQVRVRKAIRGAEGRKRAEKERKARPAEE